MDQDTQEIHEEPYQGPGPQDNQNDDTDAPPEGNIGLVPDNHRIFNITIALNEETPRSHDNQDLQTPPPVTPPRHAIIARRGVNEDEETSSEESDSFYARAQGPVSASEFREFSTLALPSLRLMLGKSNEIKDELKEIKKKIDDLQKKEPKSERCALAGFCDLLSWWKTRVKPNVPAIPDGNATEQPESPKNDRQTESNNSEVEYVTLNSSRDTQMAVVD